MKPLFLTKFARAFTVVEMLLTVAVIAFVAGLLLLGADTILSNRMAKA